MADLTDKQIAAAATTERYGAIMRTGLSPEMIGSFNPGLVLDPRLLVPIDVRALLVTQSNPVQVVPTATVMGVQLNPDGTAPLPMPPAPFGPAVALRNGVHLHWAMPDALARGVVSETGSGGVTGLPPLPDRWVVVRLAHGQTTARSWIIESDRAKAYPLAGWTEPGRAAGMSFEGRRVIQPDRLNVVAGGDVSWAATYEAVVDRFAFHDDLADLAVSPKLVLSYLVAGWWSDNTLDPLYSYDTAGSYYQRLRELDWSSPKLSVIRDTNQQRAAMERRTAQVIGRGRHAEQRSSPAGESKIGKSGKGMKSVNVPEHTVLHGSVIGITIGLPVDLAPDSDKIEVAVGPSGFAALSALLADGIGAERLASERALSAFSAGLLPTIDAPSGLVAIDEDRHASAFVGFGMGERPGAGDRVAEGDIMSIRGGLAVVAEPKKAEAAPKSYTEGAGKQSGKVDYRSVLVEKHRYDVTRAVEGKRAPPKPIFTPRTFRNVKTAEPRAFEPADVAFVLRGAARSLRHGGDGRFAADGRLACRLAGDVIRGYQGILSGDQLPEGLRSLNSGAIPPEIDLLLREAVLMDPYRWRELLEWSKPPAATKDEVATRVKAELALRYVAPPVGSRRFDAWASDTLRQLSLIDGHDPSPIATTRWAQPWIPLWCDWELEILVDEALDRWRLGPIDLEIPKGGGDPDADASRARIVRGRSPVVSAAARAFAGQIRQWLSDEEARDESGDGQVNGAIEEQLAAAAAGAEGLDVLAGTFNGLREILLGLDPTDVNRVRIAPNGSVISKPLASALPEVLAGGAARVTRLRVVDAFGRFYDLPQSVLNATEVATAMAHPRGGNRLTLQPRLQTKSRLLFRFVGASTPLGQTDVDARVDQENPNNGVNPISGWLLPDHIDESLEFFDSTGMPLGQVMHDELTGRVMWEGAPGRTGPIGSAPGDGGDPAAQHMAALAAGIVAADAHDRMKPLAQQTAESALSALLRAIDTTLWTVDPLGSIGTGAVAGLVGRPIAVVRATLLLEVANDLEELSYPAPAAATKAARAQAYIGLRSKVFTIRLGELTRIDDGLLAYAVDQDYGQLRVVAPEVRDHALESGRLNGQLGVYGRPTQTTPAAHPITHRFLAGPTDVALRPHQLVHLTLLMNPGGKVHATSGVLPRKSLALAREWVYKALARLSPSFRIGPVLVDPTTLRLPMVTGLGDRQVFTYRDAPLTWRDDPITAATQTAYLPELPSTFKEGWIRVEQHEADEDGDAAP